jgi:hypothetical protein
LSAASADNHHDACGGKSIDYVPETPVDVLATLSVALFDGLALGRLADPAAFDDAMLTQFLNFLVSSIGANKPLDDDE